MSALSPRIISREKEGGESAVLAVLGPATLARAQPSSHSQNVPNRCTYLSGAAGKSGSSFRRLPPLRGAANPRTAPKGLVQGAVAVTAVGTQPPEVKRAAVGPPQGQLQRVPVLPRAPPRALGTPVGLNRRSRAAAAAAAAIQRRPAGEELKGFGQSKPAAPLLVLLDALLSQDQLLWEWNLGERKLGFHDCFRV